MSFRRSWPLLLSAVRPLVVTWLFQAWPALTGRTHYNRLLTGLTDTDPGGMLPATIVFSLSHGYKLEEMQIDISFLARRGVYQATYYSHQLLCTVFETGVGSSRPIAY